jgi:hypothetical protein
MWVVQGRPSHRVESLCQTETPMAWQRPAPNMRAGGGGRAG